VQMFYVHYVAERDIDPERPKANSSYHRCSERMAMRQPIR
jgi:hypothetical protein